jgi:uncharacterized membrane protein YedE/YeeE
MTLPSNWTIFASGLAFGTASGLLLLLNGRIAGFSGVLGGVLIPERGSFGWKALFLAGVVLAGSVASWVFPGAVPSDYGVPIAILLLGGFLVGFGARMGNGCTSGHGVCGVGRLSKRSLVATATFVGTGFLAVTAMKMMTGGV